MRIRTVFSYLFAVALGAGLYAARGPVLGGLDGNVSAVSAQDAAGPSAEATKSPGERKILYWVDPMHPQYKSDKPGTAPDCGMDLVPVYADQESAGASFPPGTVRIRPQKLQMIGVTFGRAEARPLSKTLRTVGRVTYDETKIARIHTKFDGWIDQVFVDFAGKLVERNQPLFTVYSPELVSTQQEFLIARRARDYLADSTVAGLAASSKSLYQSARERLRLWDISDKQIDDLEQRGEPSRTLTLYSPIQGFVLTRNAFPQQRVTPDAELYTIADLSTVWVLADVYEYELPMIQLGQPAAMTLAYFPGKTFTGKVTYIYPQLDSVTRTLKVRLEFPNPGFELKPDMFANVELKIDYGRQVSVPEDAVLDSGAEQIVFVAHDGGYFEPRRVTLGADVDGRQVILSGLQAGERIVTSGNFLIDSESRLKSALNTMAIGHEHAGAPGGAAKAPPAPSPGKPAGAGQAKQHD